MAKATFFVVADTDPQNFPRDKADLSRRLAAVADWIPKRRGNNNIEFVKAAFTLLKDAGLITKALVENLSNADWCRNVFNCTMNPMFGGGVLRKRGLTMWSSNGLRYYCPFDELEIQSDVATALTKRQRGASKLAVVCEGETYYISNNWFDDENRQQKKIFYDRLSEKLWRLIA